MPFYPLFNEDPKCTKCHGRLKFCLNQSKTSAITHRKTVVQPEATLFARTVCKRAVEEVLNVPRRISHHDTASYDRHTHVRQRRDEDGQQSALRNSLLGVLQQTKVNQSINQNISISYLITHCDMK